MKVHKIKCIYVYGNIYAYSFNKNVYKEVVTPQIHKYIYNEFTKK